jgi:hypothetical protein
VTLPTFLVVGAQRAGTTLLHQVLEAHPEVFVPRRRKEVHYFDWYWGRGPNWYADFFPSEDQARRYRAIGEATPDYLFEPGVPERIRQTCPECRFIVSLRDPVQRAFSWYLYARRSFNERRSFENFIEQQPEVLQRGRYCEQLSRYFAAFGKDKVLVLIFEEFIGAPDDHLKRLAGFLGLTVGWSDPEALFSHRVNDSQAPRFAGGFAVARRVGAVLTRHDMDWIVRLAKQYGLPQLFGRRAGREPMREPTRRMLRDFYRSEIVALERLLERDLTIWST